MKHEKKEREGKEKGMTAIEVKRSAESTSDEVRDIHDKGISTLFC